MQRSHFHISDMDCPSEEQLIRSALEAVEGIEGLDFDLAGRTLTVWHREDGAPILRRLEGLDLGATLVGCERAEEGELPVGAEVDQSRVLRLLLAINATMFVVESVAGWIGESTGLLSDSLDMLADAGVYGISLWAVQRSSEAKRLAARTSGWLQLLLALGMLIEVARRGVMGSEPEATVMLGTGGLALLANVSCLLLLAKQRGGGVHMRASWIFSTNDVIANVGVLVAGALVRFTSSAIPDLVIGAAIGLIVLRGAMRILKMSAAVAD